jgi:hypothetical protein
MALIFSVLTVLCLVTAFITDSPGLLGLSLLGSVLFAFIAILGFAQAKIEAKREREPYTPSDEERELMRRAAEKRKQAAGARRQADADD